jgi:hypothetical protein
MASSAPRKPSTSSSRPPAKKPDPLHRVLAAGEEGDEAEQPARGIAGRQLDRALARGLGQVLRHAADALRRHHPGTESAAAQSGETAESIRKPAICVASPTASIRAMPKRVASQPPTRFAPIPAAS